MLIESEERIHTGQPVFLTFSTTLLFDCIRFLFNNQTQLDSAIQGNGWQKRKHLSGLQPRTLTKSLENTKENIEPLFCASRTFLKSISGYLFKVHIRLFKVHIR